MRKAPRSEVVNYAAKLCVVIFAFVSLFRVSNAAEMT